jgi:hypothetical protein
MMAFESLETRFVMYKFTTGLRNPDIAHAVSKDSNLLVCGAARAAGHSLPSHTALVHMCTCLTPGF